MDSFNEKTRGKQSLNTVPLNPRRKKANIPDSSVRNRHERKKLYSQRTTREHNLRRGEEGNSFTVG